MNPFYEKKREQRRRDGKHDNEAWVPISHDIQKLREWERKRVIEVAVCNDPQVRVTASDDVNLNKLQMCKSSQFENNFSLRLAKNIIECGYSELRNVQKNALPFLKEGCNMVLATCGASGKTNAYIFPMIQRVLDDLKKIPHQKCRPRAIVICNSKDQAKYLMDRTVAFTHGLGVNVALIFSQMTHEAFKRRDDADILFTSAFILEQAINGNRITFEHMKYFVFDGIDDAFKAWQYSSESVENVMNMVESLKTDYQMVLVADDYSALDIDFFKERINNKKKLVVLENECHQRIPPGNHYLARVREKDLMKATVKMVRSCDDGFSMVVISRVKDTYAWARDVARAMESEGISHAIYHTEMPMSERELLLTNASKGRFQVLIASFCCQLARATAFMPRARSVVFFNVDRHHQAGQNVKEVGEIIRVSTPNCSWPENTLAQWVKNAMSGSQTEWTIEDLIAADKFEDFNQPDHYYWNKSLDQDSSNRSSVSPIDISVGPPPGFENSPPGYNPRGGAVYEERRRSDIQESDFGRQRGGGYSDEDEDSSYDSQRQQQIAHFEEDVPMRYSQMRPQQIQPKPRGGPRRQGQDGPQRMSEDYRGHPTDYRGAPEENFTANRGHVERQPEPRRGFQQQDHRRIEQMENFRVRQQPPQEEFYGNPDGRRQNGYNDEYYGSTDRYMVQDMPAPPPSRRNPHGPPPSSYAPLPPHEEWNRPNYEIRYDGRGTSSRLAPSPSRAPPQEAAPFRQQDPAHRQQDWNAGNRYGDYEEYIDMPLPPPPRRGPPPSSGSGSMPMNYRPQGGGPSPRRAPSPTLARGAEPSNHRPQQEWIRSNRYGEDDEYWNMHSPSPLPTRRAPPQEGPFRQEPSHGYQQVHNRYGHDEQYRCDRSQCGRHPQRAWDGPDDYRIEAGYRTMPPSSSLRGHSGTLPSSSGRAPPRDAPPQRQGPSHPQQDRQRPQPCWNGRPRYENQIREMAPYPQQSSSRQQPMNQRESVGDHPQQQPRNTMSSFSRNQHPRGGPVNHGRRSPALPPPSQGRRSPFNSERPPSRGRSHQSGLEKKFGSMDIREHRGDRPRREGGPHQENRQKTGAPSNVGGRRQPSSSEAKKPQKPNIVVGPHFKDRHQKKKQMEREEERRRREEKAKDGKKEDTVEVKNLEPKKNPEMPGHAEEAPREEEPPQDAAKEESSTSPAVPLYEELVEEHKSKQRKLNSDTDKKMGTGSGYPDKDLMEEDC